MFLNKLKIKGFKSFARSLTINFDSSLTAIVGPNGSGKSNIVDAIRWVLGEQSASTLRGDRMADVIFAGSDSHKPLKKASVSLYLDNNKNELPVAETEVKITREIDESGHSDYSINNNSCRLKDIQELIMDTGLGRDSYSIVGQGKITSILNSKPEKLRELFEEAAGISKHKVRKQEAEKRLEKTNHNLQRIKDLISELENQVTPLHKKAQTTQKYQRLQQELSKLEISLLLDNWEKHDTELSTMTSDRDFLQKQLTNNKKVVDKLSDTLKKERGILSNKEEKRNQLQEQHYSLKTKKEEVENRLEIITERQNSLTRENKNLMEQLTDLTAETKKLRRQKKHCEEDLENIKSDNHKLSQQIKIEEEELTEKKEMIADKKEKLKSLNNELKENTKLNSEIDSIQEKVDSEQDNLNMLKDKRQKLQSQINENKKQLQIYQKKLHEIQTDTCSVKEKIKEINNNEQHVREKMTIARDEYSQIKDRYTEKKSRLNLIQDLKADYDGYYRGVKKILKNKEKFSGISGVVADLISTSKVYEQAIETALGSRMQNIVVDNDETARIAIKFLKENNGGRATFLPVNMIKGNRAKINSKITQEEGYIGLASDLVSGDENLQNIIEYLLGKTIIAQNIDQAILISKKMKNRLKIVALDGDLINPSGAITGGSAKNNNRNLLGRSRKIKELQQEISNIKKKIENKKEQNLKIKEQINKMVQRKENNKENLHQLEIKQNNLKKDINSIQKDRKQLENDLQYVNNNLQKTNQQIENHNQEIEQLDKKRNRIDEQHQVKKQIENLEIEINKMIGEQETKREEITALKIEKAELNQKIKNLKDNQNNIKKQLDKNREKCQQTEAKIDDTDNQIEQLEHRKDELKQQKKDFIKDAEEIHDKLINLKDLITKKKNTVTELNQKYEKNQKEFNRVKDELHKLELKINRLENKRERCQEQLQTEYEINPAIDVVNNRIKITNYTRTNEKISELKNSIKKLGIVDQGAIEEYEQLKERVEYLTEQQQDLLDARDSILGIISEIEETMGKQFYRTYSQVRKEFETIFEQLFSGGKAELTLTTPEDFLETGVKISAQPPGKQLKKLSLMSGGERALTAIALVFAFLRVNPSPFYILDEIDAPLDDANVIRFARFIREFSDFAQFIIVTHNKQMMSRVETIYGVSMEETGVSKLVSLHLDDQYDEQQFDEKIS